ncbi:MAG TPA: ketoacyl-ACP synthase III [Flavobacteriaceae bacterium]|nr:ketoacyl-ACP synthase III [Flavobacteriaceae bacterium]
MAYINAISFHLPEHVISNEEVLTDYFQFAGENADQCFTTNRIFQQCGIQKRFQSHPEETAKDLGNRAAEKLFAEWDISKDSIDYLIFVSDALEYKGPTTACVMQDNLGLKKSIGAIDILHGCTGFVYGISIAKALLISGQATNILVVTADVPTKVIHPSDIELRSIFSDGAAATLISNEKIENGINASVGNFVFGTDGSGEHALKVERSATKNPADIQWLRQFENVPHGNIGGRLVMKSSKIFLFALRTVPKLIAKLLENEKLSDEAISYYILHQANGQMLDFIRKRIKIEKEKFIINIEEIGNTVSASIPIALYETFKTKTPKKNDKILLAGFGIGLSWGGTIITFGD